VRLVETPSLPALASAGGWWGLREEKRE
jgi:hypothetical protein